MCEIHKQLTSHINNLKLRPNIRHFADDILKCISWNKNIRVMQHQAYKY